MKFVQIDMDILGNPKIQLLLAKRSVNGLGVYFYYIVQMANSSIDSDCSVPNDSLFYEAGASILHISEDVFEDCTNELIRIGLLQLNEEGRIFSDGFLERTGKLLASDIKRSETMKQRFMEKAEAEAAKKKPRTPKAVVEPVPESAEVLRVRDEIKLIQEQAVGVNLVSNLSGEQIAKLITKHGLHKTCIMMRKYYLWKMTTKNKNRVDYASILQDWVSDRADEEILKNGNAPAPVIRDRSHLPEGWDSWTAEQKRQYNIGGHK